jgi:hypothetical protein
MGYICIFKPTLVTGDNIIKGNCDAESGKILRTAKNVSRQTVSSVYEFS